MKRWVSLLCLILKSVSAFNCDIIGCVSENNYIGSLHYFKKYILGFRYNYNKYINHLGLNGSYTYLTTKESSIIVETLGGWSYGEKFRFMLSVPWKFIEKTSQHKYASKSGLGDINLTTYYSIFSEKRIVFDTNILIQDMWLVGGIKLPTGQNRPLYENTNSELNTIILGTGAYDFNLGFVYGMQHRSAGLNFLCNYKIATTNKHGYEYGNKFNLNIQTYYIIKIKNSIKIFPNIGIGYEKGYRDKDRDFIVTVSGERLLLFVWGLDFISDKARIGITSQLPVIQNISNGIMKLENRGAIYIYFTL